METMDALKDALPVAPLNPQYRYVPWSPHTYSQFEAYWRRVIDEFLDDASSARILNIVLPPDRDTCDASARSVLRSMSYVLQTAVAERMVLGKHSDCIYLTEYNPQAQTAIMNIADYMIASRNASSFHPAINSVTRVGSTVYAIQDNKTSSVVHGYGTQNVDVAMSGNCDLVIVDNLIGTRYNPSEMSELKQIYWTRRLILERMVLPMTCLRGGKGVIFSTTDYLSDVMASYPSTFSYQTVSN